MNTGNRVIFLTPLLTAVCSFVLVMAAVYYQWLGQVGNVALEFCEASHPGFIKQPVNTWSNLGFIAAGLYAAWQIVQGRFAHNRNVLTTTVFYPAFLCSLMVWLGPGSMAMHASTARVGGLLDMCSMYLVSTFLLTYAIVRLFKLGNGAFIIIYVVAFAVSICFFYYNVRLFDNDLGQMLLLIFIMYLFAGGLMELLIILRHRGRAIWQWGLFSAAAMGLAFAIWNLGITGRPYCQPDSLLQYHGVWHVLNAVAVYCLFRYYVSENIVTD